MSTALVWGASGGIGQALVGTLVANNWTVIGATHQPSSLNDITPHVLDANVRDPFEVQVAISEASQLVDEVDLWIYTVGDITADKTADLSSDDWCRIIEANLTGAFFTTHYSLPLLAANAHIFYVGAIHERLRLPKLGAYAAAKAGLEAFAESLRKEERKRRVTVVRPGAVDTAFWNKVPLKLPANALSPKQVSEQILEAYQQQHTGLLDL